MRLMGAQIRQRIRLAVVGSAAAVAIAPLVWAGIGGGGGSGPGQAPADELLPEEPLSAGAATPSGDGSAAAAPMTDFNKDGYADLVATSSPGGDDDLYKAGHVAVVYGSAEGSDPRRRQVIGQDSPGVPGKAVVRNEFGGRPVAKDLDGDGYTDLAVRVSQRIDGSWRGGVIALWGSEKGLTGGTYLVGDPADDTAEKGWDTSHGEDLTGGDFDGDGKADLITNLGEEKGLLKGPFTRDGASAGSGSVPLSRPEGEESSYSVDDVFAGDMTGDGADDLVVLNSNPEEATVEATHYVEGGADGFKDPDTSSLPEGTTGVMGDVDADGYADLVIQRPPNTEFGESIEVVHGSKDGPGERRERISQDTANVPGRTETVDGGDGFGAALAAGDVDADGYADIAVGSPGEEVKGTKRAGSVTLLTGGPDGLTGSGARVFHQGTPEVTGSLEAGDGFGGVDSADDNGAEASSPLRMLDANGSGKDAIAVGAPNADGGSGRVRVLPSTGGDPNANGTRAFSPANLGLPDESAQFGWSFGR